MHRKRLQKPKRDEDPMKDGARDFEVSGRNKAKDEKWAAESVKAWVDGVINAKAMTD